MEKVNYPILAFILIFISLSLIVLILFPKYQTLNKFKEEVNRWRNELEAQGKYFKDLKDSSEKLKNYENQLAKIDSALPKDPSLPSFFNSVSKLAQKTGTTLKEIKSTRASPSTEFPEFRETEITFIVSGFYPSLRDFISGLERSARMVKIEDISFSVPKEEEISPAERGIFNFELKVKIYSY